MYATIVSLCESENKKSFKKAPKLVLVYQKRRRKIKQKRKPEEKKTRRAKKKRELNEKREKWFQDIFF